MQYLYPPQTIPSIPVQGSELNYAVSRIFCIGRNYADHVKEMGGSTERDAPLYFTKAANTLFYASTNQPIAKFPYALGTTNLHYEIELVIAIGQTDFPLVNMHVDQAMSAVCGYACGIDMTRRDLQGLAKTSSHPWDLAKSFANCAVVGDLLLAKDVGTLQSGFIRLSKNGELMQNGDLNQMIWTIPEIIANLSQYYQLQAGDLIYTGTPAGVGAVLPGDVVEGEIENIGKIHLKII